MKISIALLLTMVMEKGQNEVKMAQNGVFGEKGWKGRKRQKIVKNGQNLAKNGDFWRFLKKFKKKF